jgi:hypothetical protein
MLFDLRGRGRRRTIQAIYLSLAVLMGGGLVLFGIGGNTNGGLFDAFKSGGGSSNNADAAFTKRLDAFQHRVRVNPNDAAAYLGMAKLRFEVAETGENYNSDQQAFTASGKQELGRASAAWQRYLALKPPKPDPNVASLMVQAYGQGALQQYGDAVQALEIVLDNRTPTYQLYAQLAILAAGAKQDRKSTLAEQKAISLAPKAQRKNLKTQIDLAKGQITGATGTTGSTTGSG